MEKFCKFYVHDYMDMYPRTSVITFLGEDLESIRTAALQYQNHMRQMYSGGETTFVKVLSAAEAREYLDKEIGKISHPDSADKEWIEKVNNLYNKCYVEE